MKWLLWDSKETSMNVETKQPRKEFFSESLEKGNFDVAGLASPR